MWLSALISLSISLTYWEKASTSLERKVIVYAETRIDEFTQWWYDNHAALRDGCFAESREAYTFSFNWHVDFPFSIYHDAFTARANIYAGLLASALSVSRPAIMYERRFHAMRWMSGLCIARSNTRHDVCIQGDARECREKERERECTNKKRLGETRRD